MSTTPLPLPLARGAHASPSRAPAHLPALDGLRGIAALMIVWFHCWQALPREIGGDLWHRTAVFGQTGVDLFFVLSGFLITRILIAQRDHPRYFRDFYGRRALRIFPLYFGTLAALFLLAPQLGLAERVSVSNQAWYWLYAQNIAMTFGVPTHGPAHFWSLAVEEHFYLVWPLIVFVVEPSRLRRAALVIIGSAFLCRVGLLWSGHEVFYFTLTRMDALALGALLATAEGEDWGASRRWRLAMGALGVAAVLGAVWVAAGSRGAVWLQALKFTPLAAFYGCVIAWCAFGRVPGHVERLLGRGPLAVAGRISYGLYVFHPFVILAMPAGWVASHAWLGILAVMGASCVVASSSYYLLERPFLRMKRIFSSTSLATPVRIPAPAAARTPSDYVP